VGTVFPGIGTSILAETFVVKTIHLGYLYVGLREEGKGGRSKKKGKRESVLRVGKELHSPVCFRGFRATM